LQHSSSDKPSKLERTVLHMRMPETREMRSALRAARRRRRRGLIALSAGPGGIAGATIRGGAPDDGFDRFDDRHEVQADVAGSVVRSGSWDPSLEIAKRSFSLP
jgi:hypothetical protein